jgi:hypothetical protein
MIAPALSELPEQDVSRVLRPRNAGFVAATAWADFAAFDQAIPTFLS